MSCTPTSLSRSLSPLSPSDESRFVPRSSVASSINERHFTTAEKADGEEVQRKEVADANESKATNAAANRPNVEPTVVQDDDEGIVGATICFTPEASPRSGPRPSPMLHDAVQNLESLTTSNSNNYIGSVNGVASGSTGLEAVLSGSAMHSSARQVASSLDGRSTTEYEILDGISSKGTIEVEDLILDEEDGEEYAAETELEVKSDVGPLASVSPCRTVASLDEAPLETFKTNKEHYLPNAPATPKPTLKVDTSLDGDEVDASPKVDDRPLNPFQHLHKYWEAQSNFAHMTKSAFGRFIRREAPRPGDMSAVANDPKQAAADGSSTVAEVPGSAGKEEDTAQALPFAAAKAYVSGLAGSAGSFLVSAVMVIMMFLRGSVSPSLVGIWNVLGRILVPKASTTARESMEAGKTLQNEAHAAAESPQDPPAHPGGNQSTLFVDESSKEERKGGLNQGSIPQEEVDESTQECTAAVDVVALGVLKKSMVYIFAGALAVHLRKAIAALKSSRLLFAMTSCCVLVNIVLLCACMLRRGAGVIQESGSGIREELVYRMPTLDGEDLPYTPFEEDFLYCVLTRTDSYASIPIWELNFSPLFDSEETSSEARMGSWLWVFGILSIMTSVLCALAFQPEIPFLSKPKTSSVITGIWTEDEHEQFLRGYNIHGSRWKLVSAFVPTRTHTQVRSHGSYWLRIRSPETTMKKARRVPTSKSATPVTPMRMVPDTPGSVSSTKTTPKRSNKSRSTPAKGILVQKDRNKLFKNVTPRSEGRVKRMKKDQGFMSDPPKRRVRIQTP